MFEMPKTVEAPEELHPMIEALESQYETILNNQMEFRPEEGRVHLAGKSIMLIALETIAVTLKEELVEVLGENGMTLLMYRVGKAFGRTAAQQILPIIETDKLAEKLVAGPIYAAYSGFVRVRLLPGSNIVDNDDYFLFYEHPNNFESDLWTQAGKTANEPICSFNAGYSAGWCSESVGLDLDATEILCEAAGDSACRFIMYPASRTMEYMDKADEYK
jgi:predicted hydrocarbon binding protein